MSGISTHVLDTTNGRPAVGLTVRLFHEQTPIGSAATNTDGRVVELLPSTFPLTPGVYSLVFHVTGYFPESFFPEIHIMFRVTDPAVHYHVPLLLSAYGYSTYRGS